MASIDPKLIGLLIRRNQQKKHSRERVNLKWLLYEKEGVEAAMEIWKEFVNKRR